MFIQASDGNSSDKKKFADIIQQHTASLKAALKNRYTVGDSAMCTPDSLNGIHDATRSKSARSIGSAIK